MASISITWSSNDPEWRSNDPHRSSAMRIESAVCDALRQEGVECTWGEELDPDDSRSSGRLWLEAYIDSAHGPFPETLPKDLIRHMVRAREELGQEEDLDLFLRISGTGPRYRLPDEAAKAEADFWSFRWDDELAGG